MMSQASTELVQRWLSGDESAATELYERYCQHLRRIISRHVAAKFQRHIDPDDIMQTAFRSYFRRTQRGEFRFDSDAGVWTLLVKIALTKVRLRVRRFSAGKRDVSYEIHDDHAAGTDHYLIDRISRQPGYMESIVFQRLLEDVLEMLPDELRQVLRMRVEGYTQEEIAEEMGISDRTVRRYVCDIRDIISQRMGVPE